MTTTGQRVVFDARSGVPLARAVAASRAVPSLFGPVTIGSRRYIDGALGSATNADVAGPGAVVIAPLPRVASGGVEALWIAALRAELRELGDALLIDAGAADLAAMGPDPMSGATAPLAAAAGRPAGCLRSCCGGPRRRPPRRARAARASCGCWRRGGARCVG